MKLKVLIAVVLNCVLVISCGIAGGENIPEPFRSQIEKLRHEQVTLQHQCEDLQKQQTELQAQITWNQQRINSVAEEALMLGGHVNDGYTVNLGTMKIQPPEGKR
jgi:hypothetical protein